MRNLLLFLLILFGIWWVRRALSRRGRGGKAAHKRADAGMPERMLECAHCGVHAPESEGVRAGGVFFCCDAHRRLGERDRRE